MDSQEKRLLSNIQSGDSDAFKSLFYKHSGRLCLWAYKITENKEAAEDIVQDFFIKYWENRETLSFFPSFLSYAYRAVYNASLNYLRDNEKYVYGYEVRLSGMSEEEAESEEAKELQRL